MCAFNNFDCELWPLMSLSQRSQQLIALWWIQFDPVKQKLNRLSKSTGSSDLQNRVKSGLMDRFQLAVSSNHNRVWSVQGDVVSPAGQSPVPSHLMMPFRFGWCLNLAILIPVLLINSGSHWILVLTLEISQDGECERAAKILLLCHRLSEEFGIFYIFWW